MFFTSHFLPLCLVPYFTLTLIEGLTLVVGTFASIKGAISGVEGTCSCIILKDLSFDMFMYQTPHELCDLIEVLRHSFNCLVKMVLTMCS